MVLLTDAPTATNQLSKIDQLNTLKNTHTHRQTETHRTLVAGMLAGGVCGADKLSWGRLGNTGARTQLSAETTANDLR